MWWSVTSKQSLSSLTLIFFGWQKKILNVNAGLVILFFQPKISNSAISAQVDKCRSPKTLNPQSQRREDQNTTLFFLQCNILETVLLKIPFLIGKKIQKSTWIKDPVFVLKKISNRFLQDNYPIFFSIIQNVWWQCFVNINARLWKINDKKNWGTECGGQQAIQNVWKV